MPSSSPLSANAKFIYRIILLLAAAALGACSSGGDDAAPNAGWVEIQDACSGSVSSCFDFSGDPPYTTDHDMITVLGEAFISPTANESCSETFGAGDTAATISLTGVTVSWVNETTGTGGPASQHASSVPLLVVVFCHHSWSASVPLAMGDNLFTVTASDSVGNVGRASVTITRVLDMPSSVQSTTPADNALGVSADTPITATFSEAVDFTTVNTATFLLTDDANNLVSGTVTYLDDTARFVPSSPLANATSYTATLTTGIEDLGGNSLAAEYSWQFSTESRLISVPTLITPINKLAIKQNDPSGVCIAFDWTDSESPNGIAGYRLFAKKDTARVPIVDTFITASEFTLTRCGHVIDANLEGWEWHVRPKDNLGNWGPKSETGTFRFEPCRLEDGRPC